MANRLRYLVPALFALLLCPLAAGAAEKVRVTYPNLNGAYIFLFTAIDKGYYTQEGLDIELIESGGGTATPALVSGDVQFSTSGSSAISAIMRGARLKVLLVGAGPAELAAVGDAAGNQDLRRPAR